MSPSGARKSGSAARASAEKSVSAGRASEDRSAPAVATALSETRRLAESRARERDRDRDGTRDDEEEEYERKKMERKLRDKETAYQEVRTNHLRGCKLLVLGIGSWLPSATPRPIRTLCAAAA